MQDHQGWIVFNVTDAMQHWLLSSSNSKYFTLYVVVEDLIGKLSSMQAATYPDAGMSTGRVFTSTTLSGTTMPLVK